MTICIWNILEKGLRGFSLKLKISDFLSDIFTQQWIPHGQTEKKSFLSHYFSIRHFLSKQELTHVHNEMHPHLLV